MVLTTRRFNPGASPFTKKNPMLSVPFLLVVRATTMMIPMRPATARLATMLRTASPRPMTILPQGQAMGLTTMRTRTILAVPTTMPILAARVTPIAILATIPIPTTLILRVLGIRAATMTIPILTTRTTPRAPRLAMALGRAAASLSIRASPSPRPIRLSVKTRRLW